MSRHLVALLLLAVFASTLGVRAEELKPAPLPVTDVIKLTVTENAELKNDDLEVSIARDRTRVAKSYLFPKVDISAMGLQLLAPLNFTFNKGVFGKYPLIGPIPSERINVTTDQRPVLFTNVAFVQPILQLPKIMLGVKQSEIAATLAQQKRVVAQQAITNQIKRAYLRGVELESGLRVTQDTSLMFKEVDRMTQEYLARQAVLNSEALQAKQELAKVQLEETKIRNALASTKEELNQLMGRDLRSDFSFIMVSEPPAQDIDLAAAQAKALCGRAELIQLTHQQRQATLEKRIKKLEYLPDLSLVVDYFSVFGTQIIPSNTIFAGLLVNWEPLDWGKRSGEYRIASKTLQQVANSRKQAESQILLQVNSAHRQMQQAKQEMEVAKLGQQVATEQLRVVSNRYKVQASLLRDVLRAQRDLTQANHQFTQSMLTYWASRADLEKAMGED
jgi:outer membrane protein